MAYLTYEEYTTNYPEMEYFDRYEVQAELYLNKFTTGIDNVRKLKVAFPTDEDTVAAIKLCMAELVNTLYEVDKATSAYGVTTDSNGTHGALVSVSSGSESMSFASGSSGGSAIVEAAKSSSAKNSLMHSIISNYLSGMTDSNGVNLMYMGRYPIWLVKKNV